MKRLVALLLTATMIASLAACGGAKESETTDTATATTEQGKALKQQKMWMIQSMISR